MAFYAVSTTSGKEHAVADSLAGRDDPHIHAVLAPAQLKSYIIVEADGLGPVQKAASDIHFANKVLPGQTSKQEALSFLAPKSRVEGISEGEVVEITGGPYEGKRARVQRIDREKEQVTVELHEEPIPLPIAVSGEHVRQMEEAR